MKHEDSMAIDMRTAVDCAKGALRYDDAGDWYSALNAIVASLTRSLERHGHSTDSHT